MAIQELYPHEIAGNGMWVEPKKRIPRWLRDLHLMYSAVATVLLILAGIWTFAGSEVFSYGRRLAVIESQGTPDGVRTHLEEKVDNLDRKVDAKVDGLRSEMNGRFSSLDKRFDEVILRLGHASNDSFRSESTPAGGPRDDMRPWFVWSARNKQ